MSRFDYIRYDDQSIAVATHFRDKFVDLEDSVNTLLSAKQGRHKALVMTKLEEAYMWVGKAIRGEQLEDRPYGEAAKETDH